MHRFFRAVTVSALAVGAADVWLATDLAAAQTPAATPNKWSPARLPDGQPDIQGEGFGLPTSERMRPMTSRKGPTSFTQRWRGERWWGRT